MKRPPIPRQRIYDLYWYFAFERQRIFERRIAGEPPPWTDDPILRDFKFCNVFSVVDRVSQYQIRNVSYHEEPCSQEDRLFQVIAFRIFSKIETWLAVRKFLGRYPLIRDIKKNSFVEALEEAKRANGGLYTGAFILDPASAYGKPFKHLNHVELLRDMFLRGSIGKRLLRAQSLREVYDIIDEYPGMGGFMSYQIAIALNYTDLINFSENDFTQAGPGALRGITKAFEDTSDYTPSEIILWMVEHQKEEFARRGLPFTGLWGRALHAFDSQGLFCAVDKYCREAARELLSARKRIKRRFSTSPDPIQLFLPPKWGLNDRLPLNSVLGERNNNPETI